MVQRIVVDTSVFVSALRSRRGESYRLLTSLGGPEFEVALSVPLVLEYEDAAGRAGQELRVTEADVDDILDYVCAVAHRQEIHFLWRPVLSDPTDDHVLELAVAAGCGAIVTHNTKDFQASVQFGIAVMTPGEFMRSIGGKR